MENHDLRRKRAPNKKITPTGKSRFSVGWVIIIIAIPLWHFLPDFLWECFPTSEVFFSPKTVVHWWECLAVILPQLCLSLLTIKLQSTSSVLGGINVFHRPVYWVCEGSLMSRGVSVRMTICSTSHAWANTRRAEIRVQLFFFPFWLNGRERRWW